MNIIDTSGWLEYFTESQRWDNFEKAIKDKNRLIVPTIIIYEVFKKILHGYDEGKAFKCIAQMREGQVIDLDIELALLAADISKKLKLPMADSIILATAKKYNATIWTMDADFKNIPEAKYFAK